MGWEMDFSFLNSKLIIRIYIYISEKYILISVLNIDNTLVMHIYIYIFPNSELIIHSSVGTGFFKTG